MDLVDLIGIGLETAVGWEPMGWIVLGTFIGIIVGAIPGLSSGMAVALMLPVTFVMSPENALIFLTCTYVAVTYGGSITAILLNTPGAPENTATALDGYPMTQQGRSGDALGAAIMTSALGGLLSYFIMLFGIGPVAAIALRFGPPEFFLIALMGIAILGAVGAGSPGKILASGVLGLLIGTMGVVPTGEWRATFGSFYLAEGVPVVPVLIGMFVVSELLHMVGRDYVVEGRVSVERKLGGILRGFAIPFRHKRTYLRSALVGVGVGIVPAAGATLAAFASYALARRAAKDPESYGKGNVDGIVAAETANNACSGGALITTLALGVPGSVATAVLLGALTMHGLRAGPQLVYQQIPLVYGLIMAAILSQVVMVAMTTAAAYGLTGALAIRTRLLVPVLMIFCILGAYGLRNVVFDVHLMIGFGVLGYVMKRYGYSPVGVVMGVILSNIADSELVRTFQLFGANWYLSFFERPLSLVLLAILGWSLVRAAMGRRRRAAVVIPAED